MILVHILLPALCLLRPTNNAFKQSAVQVDNRQTGSVTYSVQVNTANWEWSIFIENRSPYRLELMTTPLSEQDFLRFAIYDSSLTKLTRGCVFVYPYLRPISRKKAKKFVAPKVEGIEIKADGVLMVNGPTEMNLGNVFCHIKPTDLIQYVHESSLKVFDPVTGELVKEIKIKLATRFFKGSELGILKDSVVTQL